MQRLLAIAGLTVKAAFRFRLVVFMAALLLACVAGMPFLIRHNGTARMFTQVLLTYTLTVITALLSVTTLWLACSTLARDAEEGQLQMVAVKPVARWQIWLGKWLGLLFVNVLLLAVSAGAAYLLLQWRAKQLSPEQQRLLREEVMVARGSLKEAPMDLESDVEKLFQARRQQESVAGLDPEFVRQQLRAEVKARHEVVAPNYRRVWNLELGWRKNLLRDQPLFLRVKFHAAHRSDAGTFATVWVVGDATSSGAQRQRMDLTPGDPHEFAIPPNLYSEDGRLVIECENRDQATLLFRLDDGLELLYREGGFGLNYVRAVAVILCWLALLASVGLMTASFLSFPVAALFSLSLLFIGLSGDTFTEVATERTVWGMDHETGRPTSGVVDWFMVPLFRALLAVVGQVQAFSPVEAVSTGRSVGWAELARAVLHIVLFLGGATALVGVALFARRELGKPPGTP